MRLPLHHVRHFLSGEKRGPDSKPPVLLTVRSHTWFIGAAVCLGIFTDIFTYGSIVPVIPYSLTVQVGVADDRVQEWTAILLACYSAALFVGSPIFGLYADRTSSRRWPLLIGLLALAGSTLLLCLAKSIGLLILGRILQGLSGAVVWSVGLALLADTMGRNIGMAMGYVSIAMSVGLLIAPFIGGVVYAGAGYYAVYCVNFGLIFLDILLRLLLIEKKIAAQWTESDEEEPTSPAGVQQPALAEESDTIAKEGVSEKRDGGGEVGNDGSATDASIRPDTSPAVAARAKHPYWLLLKSRRMLSALFGCVIQAGVMFSFDTILPLFVKSTFHWSSTAAGLIFFALFIPGFVSPVVGILSDRYGARWLSLSGFVTSVPLLICLRFVTENTMAHKVLLCVLLGLMGVTLAFANIPLMAEITYAIEAEEEKAPGIWGKEGVYGIGYGFYCTSFALGGTAGSLMSGYLVADKGWGTATWVLGLWAASGAVVVGLWVGGKPLNRPGPRSESAAESNLAAV